MKPLPLRLLPIALMLVPYVVLWLSLPHEPALFLTLMPGSLGVVFAYIYITGMAEFDPNRRQLENVIDMLRGYPDDWKITTHKKRGRVTHRRYSLHEQIIIVVEYSREGGREIAALRVYDPMDPDKELFVDYSPKRDFENAILRTIDTLHEYLELKTFVHVALTADEKKSPLDKARQTMKDYREREHLGELESK